MEGKKSYELKSPYTQKNFGECGYVCIANAFNVPNVISHAKNLEKGLTWIQTRNIVEEVTDFTVQNLLFSPKPIRVYLPIFEIDHEFDNSSDLYALFFASLVTNISGFNHCVLIVKKNNNPLLTILDPKRKEGTNVMMYDFFEKYECSEVDSICNKDHGGTMFFNQEYLKHLFN